MKRSDLKNFLKSEQSLAKHSDQEVYQHFAAKYNSVPYEGDIVFLFSHDRPFNDQNHRIELHYRNNAKVPMHIYHYIVCTYCYMGKMVMKVGNEIITLYEGDLIVLDRHVPHSVEHCSENDLGINIILSDSFFANAYHHKIPKEGMVASFMLELMSQQKSHVHYLVVHAKEDDLVQGCIDQMLCEWLDPMLGSDQIIDSLIMIMLTHISRIKQIESNLEPEKRPHEQLVSDILGYIEENYRLGNLQEMCHHFGYDASYASRLIKNATGKTFKELVNEQRMKKAAMLLANKEIPVYEIAEEVGISNLTTFYKRFASHYGQTPAQYRNQL
jgi:AraC-like DNA-binding protein/quercetin dioxygenase-like cupin family protein